MLDRLAGTPHADHEPGAVRGGVDLPDRRGLQVQLGDLPGRLLSDAQVRDFIRSNFKVVQYNLFGSEEVTPP